MGGAYLESFRDFLLTHRRPVSVGLMAQVWWHFFQGKDIPFLIALTPHHAAGIGVLASLARPKPRAHEPLLFLNYLIFLEIWQVE